MLPKCGLAIVALCAAYGHTGEDACPERRDSGLPQASLAGAHLKRHGPPSAAVVAVTNGRLDGFALLAEIFGTWARISLGQAERLARES